jgi:hypothetical protein
MKHLILKAGFGIAACIAAMPLPVHAQQVSAGGSVNFTPFEAKGIKLSTIYTVDEKFAQKHGVKVPAPFKLAAPRLKGRKILGQAKPSGGGMIKLYFTTDDKKQDIFSSLQVLSYSLKTDDPEKRLQFADAVAIDLLKKLGPDVDKTRLNVRRKIKQGDLMAAEVVGTFVNKEGDRLITRLVAFDKPGTPHGLVGIVVAHPRQGKIKKVSDIFDTSASLALETVAFR